MQTTRKVLVQNCDKNFEIAVIEGEELFRYFKVPKDSPVGSVFRGKVLRVTTNGAFVDIGEDKDAFLPDRDKNAGDYVTVQVLRDAVGEKRALLTDAIKLEGRYAVVTTTPGLHASSSIEPDFLSDIKDKFSPSPYGCILRSACRNADMEDVLDEIKSLSERLTALISDGKNRYRVGVLYEYSGIVRAKNLSSDGTVTEGFGPYASKIRELSARIVVRDGVELVFDKTEAMTVVDVNAKRNFGKVYDISDYYYRVDLLAAEEAAKQIRLRNLGGLIAVDFINVKKELFASVKEAFDAALKKDFVSARAEYAEESCVAIVTRKKQ
ncbi:MAG: ribonuclease E/G [Clostridia bacterium]|nr:ribonuclease E/G [Clostridia bacterium]